eukprot:gene7050-7610_t
MRFSFFYLLLPLTSVSFSPQNLFFHLPPVQNNLISYGRFCGAGPDREIFHKFQPIDSFDTACRQHDADYDICYNVLQEEVGKNVEIPSLINQIMALRGWIPFLGSVKSQVFGRYSNYLRCMHHADRQLIHSIQEKLAHHQYPSWWNDLSKASFDLVGKHSYSEACSFGIPSTGYCLVTVKDFFHLVITFFQASVIVIFRTSLEHFSLVFLTLLTLHG